MKCRMLLSLLTIGLLVGCGTAVTDEVPRTVLSNGGNEASDAQTARQKSADEAPSTDDDAANDKVDSRDGAPRVNARDEKATTSLWTRQKGVDWPTFLGPTGDSKSPETGIITDWDKGLRMVWQRELGIGYGIGCTAAGRYYQFDRFDERGKRLGTARLDCLNAETGEEIWRFEYTTDYIDMYGYNGGPRSSPVVDGNRVYILGAEGMLHCLRADSGDLLWKIDTSKEFGVVQNFFGVGGSPVIEGGLLILMIGGSTEESTKLPPGRLDLVEGNGTGIVAFDKFTGEVKYSITDELASYASPTLATINGRRWCFVFARGGLVGFDPTKGKVDFYYPWRARILESVNASTPVVVGNEVFISETYGPGSSLLAVRPGGYEVVWKDEDRSREKAMQCHWNTPIYIDGYLYGCSGRNEPDADLRCIEWKTGKVMWVEQPQIFDRERSCLMYADGHFVCLTEFGELQLIKVNPKEYELVTKLVLREDDGGADAADGSSRRLLKSPCWSAPILSHGLLYVRGNDRLVCLELISQKNLE